MVSIKIGRRSIIAVLAQTSIGILAQTIRLVTHEVVRVIQTADAPLGGRRSGVGRFTNPGILRDRECGNRAEAHQGNKRKPE